MNLELIDKYLMEIRGLHLGDKAEKALSDQDFQQLCDLEYKLDAHRQVIRHHDAKLQGLDGFVKEMAEALQYNSINQALAHVPLDRKEVRQFMKGVRKDVAQYNKEQKQKRKEQSKNTWRQNNRNQLSQLLDIKTRLIAQGKDTHALDEEIKIRQRYSGPADSNILGERKAGRDLKKELRQLPKGTQDLDLLKKRAQRLEVTHTPAHETEQTKDKKAPSPYQKALDKLAPLLKKKEQEHEQERYY